MELKKMILDKLLTELSHRDSNYELLFVYKKKTIM